MSEGASVVVVRVTAAIACAFGLAVIAWLFAWSVRIFPAAVVLAVAAEVPPLLIGFGVLRWLRPVRPPPRAWSAAAVAWGAAAAIGCALLANDALGSVWAKLAGTGVSESWGAALTAPLDEEVLKLCGVAMIALAAPRVIRGPIDGLIIGALVGLGFQVIENATYAVGAVVQDGATNPAAAVVLTTVERLAVGFGSHWAMTAVAGAGIGFLAARGRRGAWPGVALLLLAIAMHAWIDAPPLPGPAVASALIKPAAVLAVFVVCYLVLRRRYMASARGALAAEVAAGAITQDGAASLLGRRRRRRARRRVPHGQPRHQLSAWQQAQLVHLEDVIAARAGPPGPPTPGQPAAQPGSATEHADG